MSEDFLSRWSRRKLKPDQPDAQAPAPAGTASPGIAPAGTALPGLPPGDPPALPGTPDGQELTPEEVAALTPIADFTVETDITAFLRRGVPDALRNAALRRMWSLDPKIRDYVSEAREYAYDWNTPGGVPGNGPLLATDDVEALVRKVVGRAKPPTEASEPGEAAAAWSGSSQDRENGPERGENAPEARGRDEPSSSPPIVPVSGGEEPSRSSPELLRPRPGVEPAPRSASSRRHGGAKPA